jgi:tetratricopeptide (TPR) repeat protein
MNRFSRIAIICLAVLPACAGPRRAGPARPIEKVVTHEVRDGETWRSIAIDYYQDRSRAGELAAYNSGDKRRQPAAGSDVRVPLTRADCELFERSLDAASAYNLGVESAANGNYGEAVERFQRALSIDRDMHDASFNLAVTYQKLGLHVKAVPLLEHLVEQAPGRATYFFALGHSCFHAGDLARAKQAFTETLEIDPSNTRALFSLAVVCEKLGEREEALRRWNEYLALDPGGAWADKARAHREALQREARDGR